MLMWLPVWDMRCFVRIWRFSRSSVIATLQNYRSTGTELVPEQVQCLNRIDGVCSEDPCCGDYVECFLFTYLFNTERFPKKSNKRRMTAAAWALSLVLHTGAAWNVAPAHNSDSIGTASSSLLLCSLWSTLYWKLENAKYGFCTILLFSTVSSGTEVKTKEKSCAFGSQNTFCKLVLCQVRKVTVDMWATAILPAIELELSSRQYM